MSAISARYFANGARNHRLRNPDLACNTCDYGLPNRCRAALTAGIVVLGWLGVQLAIIGDVSWMQPTTAIAGVLVLVLGSLLPQSQ
jgi:hypothetical protein